MWLRCGSNFTSAIFKLILRNDTLSTPCKIVLIWVPQNPIDEKSTLVQVMAWCCQATSHYLSQYWNRSMSPYHMASQGHNDLTGSFSIAGFKERWFKVHGNLLFYFRTNEMGYQLEGEVKLTHWDSNKMANILQTFCNAYSWMKMLEFWVKFHWNLFLWVQLMISQHYFR